MLTHIQSVHTRSTDFFTQNGRYPSAFIQTFGCQMNDRESEKLHGLLTAMGYTEAHGEDDADLVLYNTCCVREAAENRVYGRLGRLKKLKTEQPGKVIVFCGCMPQLDDVMEEVRKHHRHIDIIFGTFNKHRFPRLLHEHLSGGLPVVEIFEAFREDDAEEIAMYDSQVSRFAPHRAGVTVMHGCDNYCSYCIVPYVRGREVSRAPSDVIAEVRGLVADGAREVLLLGQNVNSYEFGFADLLREVSEVEDLRRIRFMTSHPKDLSEDLLRAYRECGKLCKHIHLPMQSGSDRILSAMNRGYTRSAYLDLIGRLREAVPDIAVTTDIIVGFPGETEADFDDTLSAVRLAGFSGAYTFKYSRREGTPAAELAGGVSKEVIAARFSRLQETLEPMLLDYNTRHMGHVVEVMAENASSGRTDDNVLVHFESDAAPGDILPVKIEHCKSFYITGRLALS